MADLTRVTTPVVTPQTHGGKRPAAPKGYADADDVARRAGVLNERDTPQNLASMTRLKRVLESGQPLRGDVPRGYYLNIRV